MFNIALFGPPGAGKGTQAAMLEKKYKLIHISTGDLFRKNMESNTALGKELHQYIIHGHLVPDEIVMAMVEEFFMKNIEANGFLFDGFPRTISQAKYLDNMLEKHHAQLDLMISLSITSEEIKKRIAKRGKEQNRIDDQDMKKVATRISAYQTETMPVARYYSQMNKFAEVHGAKRVDEVFECICELIDQHYSERG